jgi:hypothetical protein
MAHTYVDQCWYSSVSTGDRGPKSPWNTWYAIASAPDFLKSQSCGTPVELADALTDMYAGKEAIVPVVREGTREDLRQGRAKVQGLRVGLKILSFDAKQDFVEWKKAENSDVQPQKRYGYLERGRQMMSVGASVIAGGRLYLRDQGVLLCYDVKRDVR